MSDIIKKGISTDGSIRIFACDTTELVNAAQKIHLTYPIPTAALGRLLSAASMMGTMLKGDSGSITLQVRGDGPLGGVVAVGNAKGQVKGYVHNPNVVLPDRIPGKLNVGGAVGAGTLSVLCDMGLKEPYIGQVELVSGEIAEDLTAYYAISEQIPSAIALGVLVDTDGSVIKAGGFILQLMPESTDEDAQKLENIIAKLPPVTTLLNDGMTPEDIIFAVTQGFDMLVYNEGIQPEYRCDCSRVRVERAIISMGEEKMRELIEEQGSAQLTCQFCDNIYNFDKEQLVGLLENAK